MQHVSPVFAVILLVLAASSFVIWLIARAPEGHETESGFHHGPTEGTAAAPSRSVTAPVSAGATTVGAHTANTV